MINVRNKLFQRKKRQPNNTNVRHLYKLFRNRINREIKKSKRDYYNQYFEHNRNDIKKLGMVLDLSSTQKSQLYQNYPTKCK